MKWTDIAVGQFFEIDGTVFKKNSPLTAQNVSNPMMGEQHISPFQAKHIKLLDAQGQAQAQMPEVAPKPQKPMEKSEAAWGPDQAPKITVTSADSPIEVAPMPKPTRRQRKEAKKETEVKPTQES
jgi:hypothetical protein